MKNMYLELPANRSIGYRQICDFVDEKYNYFILKDKIKSANRNLAKKNYGYKNIKMLFC